MPSRPDDRAAPAAASTLGGVSRRGFLAAGRAGAAVAALSACSGPLKPGFTGAAPNSSGVTYWNLFAGGDGANMVLMEGA